MSTRHIIYDIETGPLPESYLKTICPPFNKDDVKLGNVKDPDKVAAKIKEAEEAHFPEFVKTAALSPLTGQVLAIGVKVGNDLPFVLGSKEATEASESLLLTRFWDTLELGESQRTYIVGFNSHRFDLPFLIKRSWKLNVRIPLWLRNGRYWSQNSIDLREVWQLGDYQAPGSLDAISKHFGGAGKTGSGADFARLWTEDRAKAVEYLKNDIELTALVARRLIHGL